MKAPNRTASGNAVEKHRAIPTFLKRIGILQCILAIAMLAIGLLSAGNGLLVGMMAAALFISGGYIGWKLPDIVSRESKRETEEHRRSALKLLAHYRHDVMNQVQLLQAYMQLKKFDRLQSPLQKLVRDAQRHTQICNLPGSELPYQLMVRDLSAPLLHLRVVWGEQEFTQAAEAEWLKIIEGVTALGELHASPEGRPVEWIIHPAVTEQEIVLKLDVLGEDVNDTYMEELTEELNRHGWTISSGAQEAERNSIVLRQER